MSSSQSENVHRDRPPAPGRWLKLVIAVAVLTLAVGYLIFSSVKSSSAYYMTIGELKAAGASVENRKVRVAGTLLGDSVRWDARSLRLDFTLTDADGQLPVSYKGARPDMFRDGAETVVEGKYSGGSFQATNLLLKCPSKYSQAASSSDRESTR